MADKEKNFSLQADGSRVNVQSKSGKVVAVIQKLLFVNNKPIICESYPFRAAEIKEKLEGDKEAAKVKIEAVKELSGTAPEFLLLVPKGEGKAAERPLKDFFAYIGKLGAKGSFDELPVDAKTFELEAKRIMNEKGANK